MDQDRDLLLVALFTTLTVFLWVFFELVKTTKTSTVTTPVQQIVSPLSSNIDIETLNRIAARQTFD